MKPIFRVLKNLTKSLSVLILVVFFLVILDIFFVFSPQEVTELQKVPLILQGGTDLGGSNIYAAYVTGHTFFGLLWCLSFSLMLNTSASTKNKLLNFVTNRYVILGYFVAFLLVNAPMLNLFTMYTMEAPGSYPEFTDKYFVCDYFQTFLLFAICYLSSFLMIFTLSRTKISFLKQLLLLPSILILFIFLAKDGITPKAGQVVQQYVVPKDTPNSSAHSAFIEIHKLCRICTGFHFNNNKS